MVSKLVLASMLSFAHAGGEPAGGGMYQKLHKHAPTTDTCEAMRDQYAHGECCGAPAKQPSLTMVTAATPMTKSVGDNICADKKVDLPNDECYKDGVLSALEQSGTVVTEGYKGNRETTTEPITTNYFKAGLCPVNVHWHLGTEHYSAGEFDSNGHGPSGHLYDSGRRLSNARHNFTESADGRRLGDDIRLGFRCHHYDASDPKFTTEYKWQYCQDMVVGETYEVHWPHSTMGDCGTVNQFQTPFYDGVFCHYPTKVKTGTHDSVGVQGQIFTIVNDESYYYPDLIRGAIVDGPFWNSVAYYTGSTTGTSRNNVICSSYAPITWQVDRKCHLISASSFDKMCYDMLQQRDDMSGDVYPHGARELVEDDLAADNHQRLRV